MQIAIELDISKISNEDLDNSEYCKNKILTASLQVAGEAMLELDARRWQRFIQFCQTGKFD